MDLKSNLGLIDEKEKKMNHIYSIQNQKKYYLGEYRERIIVALKVDQLLEGDLYPEIIAVMDNPKAKYLKMRRDIGLTFLKPYIKEAERKNFRYELIDGLSYLGDIGLVVVTDESLDNEDEELVIRDMNQDFLDVGLGPEYSKNQGKHVCNKCHLKVEDKLPDYIEKFKRLTILDKLLGVNCPVCKDRKKMGGK